MKASTITKGILNIFTASVIILSISVLIFTVISSAFAKKGGNGEDKPRPEPVECTDKFPGFIYGTPESRKSPGETRLSSVDGCRTELLESAAGNGTKHVTEDWSKGVMQPDQVTDGEYRVITHPRP